MTQREKPTATGRTRHRVMRVGPFWKRRDVLVLQHEFSGLVTEWAGGQIETEWDTWWKDALPEWVTTEGES